VQLALLILPMPLECGDIGMDRRKFVRCHEILTNRTRELNHNQGHNE
jgi:hypothetical protein